MHWANLYIDISGSRLMVFRYYMWMVFHVGTTELDVVDDAACTGHVCLL